LRHGTALPRQACTHDNEPGRIRIRQGLEQHGLDDANHHRRRRKPEGERQNNDDGEHRANPPETDGEHEVLEESVEHLHLALDSSRRTGAARSHSPRRFF
jgi:hypothetical protein